MALGCGSVQPLALAGRRTGEPPRSCDCVLRYPIGICGKGRNRNHPDCLWDRRRSGQIGLVDSFNQPAGNLTGISNLISGLGPKRFELLHELIPNASTIAVLVNPDNPNAPAYAPETQAAADALRVHLEVLTASSEDDLEMAFTIIAQRRAEALVVMADPIFLSRGQQLVVLAARHAVPAIFPIRMYAELGGLVSYGTDYIEEYQKMGTYTGKILKGAKPIDLPVQQSTKLELVINLKTAKALGLTVPDKLLAIADEVIE
jgi:putative tryptophan/tyrosine transport system substrate-binding protein